MAFKRIVKITLPILMAALTFIAIIVSLIGSFTFSAPNIADASDSVNAEFGGSGTASSPYLISNRSDLIKLSELINSGNSEFYYDKYYRMTADIDLGGVYNSDSGAWSGENFMPIGTYTNGVEYYFSGVFDGNGYAVKNIYMQTSSTYVGLFGLIQNGTIRNLGVESGYIEGEQYVGGIAGSLNNGGRIESCYNKAVIKANGSYAGGITGYVGFSSSSVSVVTNCYNAGTIASQRAIVVGGIAGCNDGEVSYCYNISMVNASSPRGAIIGRNLWHNSSNVVVKNIYYNRDLLAQGGTDAATGAVGQSRVSVEDNKLTASKMVTLYGASKPSGMDLPSSVWSFKRPNSVDALEHYYPQQSIMKTPAIAVDVYPNTYTVTFNLNGASGSVPEQKVREGEYADEPVQPARAGYTFVHWSTDVYNRTGKFDFVATRITDNTVLYAIWVFKDPLVEIVSTTGLSVVYGNTVVMTAQVTHGASDVEYAWYKRETTNTQVSSSATLRLTQVLQSGDYYCKVTVKDGTNVKSVVSSTVRVTIEKAVDPTYKLPETQPVTYFEGITLEDIALPNGYAWTRPSSSLNATGEGGVEYDFVFTPSDTNNYKNMYAKARVYVNKANYSNITHPALSATYYNGITLGNCAELRLNENFIWREPDYKLNAADNLEFEALYNKDSTNYNDFLLKIVVTIRKANPVVNPQYNENLYANVNLDLVELRLSDGDTEGVAKLNPGQTPQVGKSAYYSWTFTPADTRNYESKSGQILLFIYEISLQSIYVSQLPTVMEYSAYESLNTDGLVVMQVFNNGDEEATLDYRIVYIGNESRNYFLYNSTELRPLSKSVRIELATNPEIYTLIEGISVRKAEYSDSEAAHEPVGITYFNTISYIDLQALLKENYTLRPIGAVKAGDGQEFPAIYNADALNYQDKTVVVVFNIAKAVYGDVEHKAVTAVYTKNLVLNDIQLSRSFYWEKPMTLLSAGTFEYPAYFNDNPDNYENKYINISVTVNLGLFVLEDITFESATFEYDGDPHSIFINGELPEGVTVEYINNGVSRAGVHTVTASFVLSTPENYHGITPMTATVTIVSKKITVDFNPDFDGTFSYIYDEDDPFDIDVFPSGVEPGDNVTVEIKIVNEDTGVIVKRGDNSISGIFEPGSYVIYTSIYNNENYKLIGETSRRFIVKSASIQSELGDSPQVILVSLADGANEPAGFLLPKTALKVSTVDVSGTAYDINVDIVTKIGDYEVKQVFDLMLVDAFDVSKEVDLGGLAQVRIRIPEALKGVEGLKIAYVDENNLVTDTNAIIDGDYLCFNVTHLSHYAIIAPTDNPVDPVGPDKPVNPVTPTPEVNKPESVWSIIAVIAVVVVGCCIVTWVFIYKK